MYNRYIRTMCAAILLAAAVSALCSARAMAAETKVPAENITADMPQAEESCAAENSVPVDAVEDGNDVSCGDTGRDSAYDDISDAAQRAAEQDACRHADTDDASYTDETSACDAGTDSKDAVDEENSMAPADSIPDGGADADDDEKEIRTADEQTADDGADGSAGNVAGSPDSTPQRYGWSENGAGISYIGDDGISASGWTDIDGERYYFDKNGILLTGIVPINGRRYFLPDGHTVPQGWNRYNGKPYFVKADGTVKTGWMIDGSRKYYFGADGSQKTGWAHRGDERYYLNSDGTTHKGWLSVDGRTYLFDNNGVMRTGWLKYGGGIYCFDSNGAMHLGWAKRGGKYYYLKADGTKHTGWLKTDDGTYFTGADGARHTGWLTYGGHRYYFWADGKMNTGWLRHSGDLFRFGSDGKMLTGTAVINGRRYFFSDKGRALTRVWKTISGKRYYFRADGRAAVGPVNIGGDTYLFSDSGVMLTGIHESGGRIYKCSVKGVVADVIDTANVVSLMYDSGMALSAAREDAYKNVSARISAAPYNADDNAQKWELIKSSSGTYRIRNVFNGAYLMYGQRFGLTMQDDVLGIEWTVTEDDNGMSISPSGSGRRMGVTPVRCAPVSRPHDIVYTDTYKVYSDIVRRFKNGEMKDYTIRCSYTDAKKISSMLSALTGTNSEFPNVVKSIDVSSGTLTVDMKKGTAAYRQCLEVEKAMARAETGCGVRSGMSCAEKIRQINRYICTHYRSIIGGSNMYQMMVKKRGSCVQHAMLFNHLCSRYGIAVENVHLEGRDGMAGHMLCRVKINGVWRYCDVMFNNSYGSRPHEYDETFLFMKDLRRAPLNAYAGMDLSKTTTDGRLY